MVEEKKPETEKKEESKPLQKAGKDSGLKPGEEKEYTVPLRRKFQKTPRYKRVPKAVKALKKFIARNMKIRDGDLRKIKIDKYLNEELWFRGIKNPPAKIKVKAKMVGDNVLVELAEIPEKVKWKKQREERAKKEIEEKAVKKKEEKKAKEKVEEKEEAVEEKEEKKEATVEAGLKAAEKQAREVKAETKMKVKEPKHLARKALKK